MAKSGMRPMHEHCAEAAWREVMAFGKFVGGQRVAANLKLWEREYGANTAALARKLIMAKWREKWPGDRPGQRPQGVRDGVDP